MKLCPVPFAAIVIYLAIYAFFGAWLHASGSLSLVEPLTILVVVGGGFTVAAWLVTRGCEPLVHEVRDPARESALMLALWLVVAAFVTWGLPLLRGFGGLTAESLVLLGKLAFFVALPALSLSSLGRHTVTGLLQWPPILRRHWVPLVGMSCLLIVFQWFAGRGGTELAQLAPPPALVVAVVPIAFLWLVLEVGLVEEFFFRALLQARLTRLFGSPTAAIVATALLFGLMHAPAYYLRPGLTGEALGDSPSLLHAVGTAVLITSTTGFFLGVLWHRTRNLWLLACIHAAADLVPGLPGFIGLLTAL